MAKEQAQVGPETSLEPLSQESWSDRSKKEDKNSISFKDIVNDKASLLKIAMKHGSETHVQDQRITIEGRKS